MTNQQWQGMGKYYGYSPSTSAATSSNNAWNSPQNIQSAGLIMSIGASLTSMIGGYYSAKAKQYELKSQASAFEFQQRMADINASIVESQVETIIAAGQQEIGKYTMGVGQARKSLEVGMAARGIKSGVGSAANILASGDVIKQIDIMTMKSNIVRAAEAKKVEAQNIRSSAMMYGTQAGMLRTSAGSISPNLAATSGLLSAGGQISQQWAAYRMGYNPYMRY